MIPGFVAARGRLLVSAGSVVVRVVVTGWAAFLLTAAGLANAWNDTGHLLMARLTFAGLSAGERTALLEVLAHHPRYGEDFEARVPASIRRAGAADEWLFAQASIWPDTVRRFDHVRSPGARERLIERYHHGPWHYVNIVLEVDAAGAYVDPMTRIRVLPVPAAEGPDNIIEALDELTAGWRSASEADRAVALCWILHLVADLHQPLHAATLVAPGTLVGGDRGGNEIRVSGTGDAGRNLHAVWDAALGRTRRWSALGRTLSALRAVRVAEDAGSIDFRRWAIESATLARGAAYTEGLRRRVAGQSALGEAADYTLDAAYLDARAQYARTQIVLSASRADRVLRALPSATPAAR